MVGRSSGIEQQRPVRAAQVVEYGRRRYAGCDAASAHLPAHVDPRYPFEHVRIGLLFSDELREERRARFVERHSAGLTTLRLSDSDMILVNVRSNERLQLAEAQSREECTSRQVSHGFFESCASRSPRATSRAAPRSSTPCRSAAEATRICHRSSVCRKDISHRRCATVLSPCHRGGRERQKYDPSTDSPAVPSAPTRSIR